MTMTFAPSPLVYAASDRKHRPASHPVRLSGILTEDEYHDRIARRILLRRKERGWSQARLGDALGVSPVTICHWEQQTTRPTAWHLELLDRVLGGIRP